MLRWDSISNVTDAGYIEFVRDLTPATRPAGSNGAPGASEGACRVDQLQDVDVGAAAGVGRPAVGGAVHAPAVHHSRTGRHHRLPG